MIEIRKTHIFAGWIDQIKDSKAKARILVRIDRLRFGHFGDVKSEGDNVRELRIFYGPGYRVYFTQQGSEIVILLCGGDKSSQKRDIAKAKELARQLER
ncbi:type II toxin-antitoxin system RelE/ParE family toxin [Halioxenophilus aromaticivorans]|uniref:Type II toxin-antitoxin system RelE/ParE family toxin n=1 Tax=Halioxenophilus aromaticivorans TaxID=1306992 RepID=A0AAV3TY33_9ALTE